MPPFIELLGVAAPPELNWSMPSIPMICTAIINNARLLFEIIFAFAAAPFAVRLVQSS